jgi:dTDP-4-amino-4,6-dideoxygalactose transaminase
VSEALRDKIVAFLNSNDIEAKVHYPVPLQGVLELLGHSREEFPMAYRQSDRIITLPVHECLTTYQMDFVVQKISDFMKVAEFMK